MKVYLNMDGPLSPLYRHFNLEGDSISRFPDEAEMILNDATELLKPFSQDIEPVKEITSLNTDIFTVSRYYDGKDWSNQIILGIPLTGLMNDNLGPSVCVGCGLRYIKDDNGIWSDKFNQYTSSLAELGTKDFVTLRLNFFKDLLGVQTSIPFYGLFSVLEGVRGKLSEWFERPTRLYESWVVSVLVTQHPWPELEPSNSRNKKVDIREDLEKHFWSFPLAQQQRGLIGIATAWAGIEDESIHAQHGTLRRAASFALKTAASIEVAEKQYRTDVAERVQEQWIRLKGLGVV